MIERDNIVVDGAGYTLQGTGTGTGIYLSYRSNLTICNMEIKAFYHGIRLDYSSNNSMVENNITNSGYGIGLYSSSNNGIVGNNITANNLTGIWLYSSSNNTIYGNNITSNWDSIGLFFSSNNTIYENNITSNQYGIRLHSSSNNKFCHNNFIDNTQQVYIETFGYANFWDDGYPSGGNYWSDYTDVDVKNGPNQDQPSSDGIGDTPYIIDANNTDHYPLMYPWSTPPPPSYTLTIYSSPTGVTFTVDGVSRTTPWSGTYSEGTSVSLVMPETHNGYIWSHWLEDGDTNRTKTIVLTGNTTWTGVFAIPGDINGDGTVDIHDIVIAALAFGSKPGYSNWNPQADVYQDGIIDIFDLVTIAINYGKKLPL